MNYKVNQFLNIFNIIPDFYVLIVYIFLTLFVIVSWLGRLNTPLKGIIFSRDDADSHFHFARYTLTPTAVFIGCSIIVFGKLNNKETNWLDYGSTKNLLLFGIIIACTINIIVFSELHKKQMFGNDPGSIKAWIPFIVIVITLIIFIGSMLLFLL